MPMSQWFMNLLSNQALPSWPLDCVYVHYSADEVDCSTGKGITFGRPSPKQIVGATFAVQLEFKHVTVLLRFEQILNQESLALNIILGQTKSWLQTWQADLAAKFNP